MNVTTWDATTWAAISAVAAAVSAIVTLFIARANTSETRTANRSADFSNCMTVVASLSEAQRRVFIASDNPIRRTFEFRELLNLMEALARLINDGNMTPSTQKITEDFLVEAWAYLHVDPALQALITQSVTGPDTYRELLKFAKKRSSRIAGLIEAYRQQNANQTQATSVP